MSSNKYIALDSAFVYCISIIIQFGVADSLHHENSEENVFLPNTNHIHSAIFEMQRIINKEFRNIGDKFDDLNSKIDGLKGEQLKSMVVLSGAARKIDTIDNKVVVMDKKLESLNKKQSLLKVDVEYLDGNATLMNKQQLSSISLIQDAIGKIEKIKTEVELLLLNSTIVATTIIGAIDRMRTNNNESFESLDKKMDSMETQMVLLDKNNLNVIASVNNGTRKVESIRKALINLDDKVQSIEEETLSLLHDKNRQIISLLDTATERMENSEKTFDSLKSNIDSLHLRTDLLQEVSSNTTISIRNTLRKMESFEKTFAKLDYVNSKIEDLIFERNNLGINNTNHGVNDLQQQIRNSKIETSIFLEHETAHGIQKLINCGGALVTEKGTLLFQYDLVARKCIWTVRANRRSKVTFYMEANPTNNTRKTGSFITLTPYHNLANATTSTSRDLKILLTDTNRYEVDGPLVFVTLHWESNNGNEEHSIFKLHFFGSSPNENETVKYSHYHFSQNSGQVKYPFYGEKYQSNELATFVINPSMHTNFSITLQNLNIEVESRCRYDSLRILHDISDSGNSPSSLSYYGTFGPNESDHRYCGILNETNEIIQPPQETTSAYILIFKSDRTFNFNGFKFCWNV